MWAESETEAQWKHCLRLELDPAASQVCGLECQGGVAWEEASTLQGFGSMGTSPHGAGDGFASLASLQWPLTWQTAAKGDLGKHDFEIDPLEVPDTSHEDILGTRQLHVALLNEVMLPPTMIIVLDILGVSHQEELGGTRMKHQGIQQASGLRSGLTPRLDAKVPQVYCKVEYRQRYFYTAFCAPKRNAEPHWQEATFEFGLDAGSDPEDSIYITVLDGGTPQCHSAEDFAGFINIKPTDYQQHYQKSHPRKPARHALLGARMLPDHRFIEGSREIIGGFLAISVSVHATRSSRDCNSEKQYGLTEEGLLPVPVEINSTTAKEAYSTGEPNSLL